MLRALKGGCNARHTVSYRMSRPQGLPNYVLLVTRSDGEFHINSSTFPAGPGYAVLLAPNTPYSYWNPNGEYVDDWLHFDVTDPALDERLREISNQVFPAEDSRLLSWCIRQTVWELTFLTEYTGENADALLRLLLNHLFLSCREQRKAARPYQKELRALRLEVLSACQERHSVKEYAARLHVSESYFQHLYSEYFGTSFCRDVIAARVGKAQELLLTTDLPLSGIARLCGYANEVHFFRQFKKVTGVTPAGFRGMRQG